MNRYLYYRLNIDLFIFFQIKFSELFFWMKITCNVDFERGNENIKKIKPENYNLIYVLIGLSMLSKCPCHKMVVILAKIKWITFLDIFH